MPVTAKLSKAFYDRVGEQAANELVDWFNAVDATYRSDLRDINDRNLALFDAKLEQRLGAFRSQFSDELKALEVRQLRWMFVFWATTAAAILLK